MGQANCAKFLLFTLKIIVTLIRILKIVIPLSLIIISMYSFFKVVTSGDDGALKKAAIDSGKRILAGVLVFLVPTIVGTAFNYFEGSKETMSHLYACYKDIDNYTIPQILALDPHEYEDDDGGNSKIVCDKNGLCKIDGYDTSKWKPTTLSEEAKKACQVLLDADNRTVRLNTCSECSGYAYDEPNAALPGGATERQVKCQVLASEKYGEMETNYVANNTIPLSRYFLGVFGGEEHPATNPEYSKMFILMYRNFFLHSVKNNLDVTEFKFPAGSCTQNYRENIMKSRYDSGKYKDIMDDYYHDTRYLILVNDDGTLTNSHYSMGSHITEVMEESYKSGDNYFQMLEKMKSGHKFVEYYQNAHIYDCRNTIDPHLLDEDDDEPISGVNNPPAGANIIAKATSKTMVFQIEKVNESSEYFLSYIWVKDPYNQNYKQHAKDYGKSNELPSDILTDTGIKNKNIIATNASGFYFVGIWTPSTNEEYQRKYNYTQEGGLVITNGQVIRNWYQNVAVDRARNDTIYGIDRTGTLVTFPKINSYTEQERKNLFQSVINTGMKNTITFRPQIIKDGKIVEWVNASSGTNHLTIFCQVDHNNFMLLHATQVIARHRAAQILLDHGCKTAVNFDGGGSVTLLYKKANEDYKVITGNNRKMSEIFYFTD